MKIDALRRFCDTLPGATHDVKWGADHCWSVGSKMFVVFGPDDESGFSFKVDPERFLELTDRDGIVPAPYLARAHWVKVEHAKALSDAEAKALVARSHALVLAKLPKALQASIAARLPARGRRS